MHKFVSLFLIVFLINPLLAQDNITYTEGEIKNHSSFLDAKISLFKGDTTEAIEHLEKVLKTEQKSMAAYLLSNIYENKKDYSEAINYGLKATDIANEEGYLLHMLKIYHKANENEAYQSILKKLIILFPKNQGYFYRLIDDLIKHKSYKEALKLLTKKQKSIGIKEAISKREFEIFMAQKKTKKAEKTLQVIAKKYPNELAYLYNLASFYSQTSQIEKSKQIYKKILLKNPDDKAAQSILNLQPSDNADIAILQGLLPVVENKESNIDDIIKRLLPYIDNIDQDQNQGISDILLLLCQKLSASHPTDAKANAVYADMLNINGDLEKSKQQYIKTLQIDKSVFSVWNQLFSILHRLKAYNVLIDYTNQAMDLYPNQASVYIYHSLGQSMNGDVIRASTSLEDSKYMVSTSDNHIKQLNKLAITVIDIISNRKDKAIETLLEFEQNKEKLSQEILGSMSELFKLLGDNSKAVQYETLAKSKNNK